MKFTEFPTIFVTRSQVFYTILLNEKSQRTL